MIPKIIHYCWFGNLPKSQSTIIYINQWKQLNPDFELMEWNETNFDIHTNCYVEEAYYEKKWAFVSDYARLYALEHYGGIYLDTDVEEIKCFSALLDNKFFIGAESQFSMCTATIGAEKHSVFIKEIMKTYENEHFIINGKMNKTPNSHRIFYLLSNNHQYKYSAQEIQTLDIGTIYPPEYFSPINCYTFREEITNKTISIHRYASTWKSKDEQIKNRILAFITRIIGEKNRNRLKVKIKK